MRSVATLRTMTVCAALAVSVALVGIAAAEGLSSLTTRPPIEGTAPVRIIAATDTCSLIDFEGIPNLAAVGVYVGPVTVTFGTSWLGLIDADNGGSGNFANEPSPSTIAFFVDTNDISINLNPGVRFVRFGYVASAISLPIVVTAYDAANNVITTANGSTVGTDTDGAACAGDPTGNFCLWGEITLASPTDIITRVTITGTVADQFGIDNLIFCVQANPTSARTDSWGRLKMLYR